MSPSEVPWLSSRILWLAADPERRDAQLGDLAEEHADRSIRDPQGADRWYRRQALRSMAPNLAHRARRAYRALMGRGGDGMMKTLFHDLRLALRAARQNFAFSAVIVLTLALGIGANTTIFSVVYGLVLSPFPFPEPERIVGVGTAYPKIGSELRFFEHMSPAEFEDIRDNTRTLEAVVAWDMGNRQIDTDGPPENVFSAFWWGDALRTLGMDAHLGRGFSQDEIETGAPVVMLSQNAWTDRYGADSSMVGNTIGVNGNPYTLIGIIPAGVDIYGTDLWMTMAAQPSAFARNRRQFQVMARVREGVSLREVNTELEGLARRVEQSYGAEFEEYEGWSMHALTWNDVSSRSFRTGVWVLLGAVTFVLLLVCANTANLLLARAQARRSEMAVRTALGAGRGRLVAQLLTESVALALMGGVLGVAFAYAGVRGVLAFVNTLGLPIAGSVEINGPVLVFTAAVAVAAGVIFGLAPAVQASRVGIAAALQADGKATTSSASRQRLQRTLVGLEVALAFVLLAGGGLLVNSFVRVSRVDPGFDSENVLTMRLTLPREKFEGQAGPAFFRELTERLEALPGVREAAAGTQFPGVAFAFRQVFFDTREADAEATLPTTLATVVTSGYFEALGIPIQRGRTFDDGDQEGTPLVAVINETAARRFFPGEDAVGKRLKLGEASAEVPWWEIVGVVGSTRNLGLDQDPFPEVFAVHQQIGGVQNQLFLLLRTDTEPRALIPAVRSTVLEMDPDQAVYAIRTIEETYRQSVAPMRATTLMLSLFAGFALILAAVGIYSVVSFTVGQRTQEIGLRMALGADPGRVHRLVVRQALLPVVIGAVIGAAGAVVVSRGLEQLLFEITGTDPFTLVSVGVILVVVAVVASWVPAFRASRLDPVEALRAE